MSKVRSWHITAQAQIEGKGEQMLTTFVRANNRKNAEKAGQRSILRMPGVISVGPATATDARWYPMGDPRFA